MNPKKELLWSFWVYCSTSFAGTTGQLRLFSHGDGVESGRNFCSQSVSQSVSWPAIRLAIEDFSEEAPQSFM